jgi:hypothetical protein
MSLALDLFYRIVVAALGVYCARTAWRAWTTRRIRMVDDDWLDWSRWSRKAFHRDLHPELYWLQLIITGTSALACLVSAIIGWQPGS